jgi:hypothetical protein
MEIVTRRRMPRLVLAIAVIPLIALIGFQSAWAFACRIDGEVRDQCCCGKAESGERREVTPDAPVSIQQRCCCDISMHALQRAPDAREPVRDENVAMPATVASIESIAPPIPVAFGRLPATTERPPPPRIPRFLKKRAILR